MYLTEKNSTIDILNEYFYWLNFRLNDISIFKKHPKNYKDVYRWSVLIKQKKIVKMTSYWRR